MYIQRYTFLQNREQIRKYNNFEKVLLVWEKWREKKECFNYFFMDSTKKIIQWIKNMSNFRKILVIESQPMWVSHLWEEGSDIFLKKK